MSNIFVIKIKLIIAVFMPCFLYAQDVLIEHLPKTVNTFGSELNFVRIDEKAAFFTSSSNGGDYKTQVYKINYNDNKWSNSSIFYLDNNFQLIWQCGNKNIDNYKKNINNENILLKGFFDDISAAYSAADIVISRAGAVAISEISFIKKPMILIPLPTSAGNHQFYNASTFLNNRAAIMIQENELKYY